MEKELTRKQRRTQAHKLGSWLLKNSQWYKDQQRRKAKKRRKKK